MVYLRWSVVGEVHPVLSLQIETQKWISVWTIFPSFCLNSNCGAEAPRRCLALSAKVVLVVELSLAAEHISLKLFRAE